VAFEGTRGAQVIVRVTDDDRFGDGNTVFRGGLRVELGGRLHAVAVASSVQKYVRITFDGA
jgi:hypothetical protein